MSEDLIWVIDVANHHGKHEAGIFKALKRLGIEPKKLRSAASRGQLISYITNEEFRRVSEELQPIKNSGDREHEISGAVSDAALADEGVFYLLQLEPHHDPGRFKVGFAVSLSGDHSNACYAGRKPRLRILCGSI